MKKILLQLTLIAALFLQACQSKPLEDTKLEQYDLTITSPKLDAPPEFTNLKFDETDTELSRYDFNMGGNARVNVIEIAAAAFPTDTTMLKSAVSGSEDFIELLDTKQLANGAFGVIYKMKGSSGATIKNYNFYFKKGNRFFKMEPVFNSELNDLDQQLAAFESLK
ncbi:MAG: hypothetical protein BGO31_12425 [Bacteroidetes bacterium 43-16]|nr:MAG: hypothetical protein BGO31_12425 [Bacteroidetes bacterium 43-16]